MLLPAFSKLYVEHFTAIIKVESIILAKDKFAFRKGAVYIHICLCTDKNMENNRKNTRPARGSFKQRFAQKLDMPSNAFGGAQIELISNREAAVEGCLGVLEYNENEIALNLGDVTVTFSGSNLKMKCMTSTATVIEGNISSLQFK